MTIDNKLKNQSLLLRWNYLALFILACLMIYQTAQNNLFSRGFTDFGQNFHIADSIIGSLLLPGIFFSLGYIFSSIKSQQNTSISELFFDKFLYIFIVWVLFQNLVEVFFSGYTGSSALLGDIWFDLSYQPANHLGLLMGVCINLITVNLLVKVKNPILIISLIIGFSFIYLNQLNLPRSYPLNYLFSYIVFAYAGTLIFTHAHHFSLLIKRYRLAIILVAICAQYVFHGYLSQESYAPSVQLLLLSSCSIIALLSLSTWLSSNSTRARKAGLAAIFLYLFHYTFIGGTREIFVKTFQFDSSKGHLLLALIFSITASLLIFRFRKTFPLPLLLQPPKFLSFSSLSSFSKGSLFSTKLFKLAVIFSFSVIPCSALLIFIGSQWRMEQLPRPESSQFSIDNFSNISIPEGERLANIYGCNIGCHGNNLQGKTYHRIPLRGIYTSPNLTLSTINNSDEELEKMIRQGFRTTGRPIMAGMPSAGYSTMPDEHLANILFFIRSRPTIDAESVESRIGLLTRFEILTENYAFADTEIEQANRVFRQHSTSPSNGERWVRSACTECHGNLLEGDSSMSAPPLAIVRAFTYEQFEQLMRTGVGLTKEDIGLMKTVALTRFKHLSDSEIREIYEFLTAVPIATSPNPSSNQQTRNTSLANL